ncbi:hypothetical protein QAD02_000562 [Eretmocerus hayati]|uniref:Uncharacterized protein n=1 Tax=Eretmocerus hayati TaxID=131215 RepID=A0ACC2NET7_9HYME|nr:hypothetical protein QAD02_000562 [Eretmocerus hayati]
MEEEQTPQGIEQPVASVKVKKKKMASCPLRFLLLILKILVCIYILLFGLFPLAFRYSYQVQIKMLFLNFVHWPLDLDLTKPELLGMKGTRNFYLTTDQNVTIGSWQVLPQSLLNHSIPKTGDAYEAVLRNAKRPVFIYMHGNGGNRASSHRVKLYKLLQRLDYHIICFDYRSYGDSSHADLSEMGVVSDSKFVLEWAMKTVKNSSPIFVWGHSLGTGVASHVLAILAENGMSPAGLFLEAPFNNLADEVNDYALSRIFKHLPWFHWAFVEPLYDNELRFESDKHIGKIQCPVMILHAEDDIVVPFSLGEKLFTSGRAQHADNIQQIQMTKINSSFGLGHVYIWRYKHLPRIIR